MLHQPMQVATKLSRFSYKISNGFFFNSTRVNFSADAAFNSAMSQLKLSDNLNFSNADLRNAYFTAAKLCHPDLNKTKDSDELSSKFLKITEAYEYLQQHNATNPLMKRRGAKEEDIDWTHYISKSEEQLYRDACQDILGLDAETVEESKKCSLFRDWLKGKTDAAFHWNNFFMLHGGLAPMLRNEKIINITSGEFGGRRRKRLFRKKPQ